MEFRNQAIEGEFGNSPAPLQHVNDENIDVEFDGLINAIFSSLRARHEEMKDSEKSSHSSSSTLNITATEIIQSPTRAYPIPPRLNITRIRFKKQLLAFKAREQQSRIKNTLVKWFGTKSGASSSEALPEQIN
jgi:hypothetical protein